MVNYIFISFSEMYDALQCEKVCRVQQIPGKLVTIPRELSAGCGYAWRSEATYQDIILTLLEEKGVAFEAAHCLDR